MTIAARITKPARTKKRQRFSFEEFCKIIQDGQKADLLDGAIYIASPDNTDAGKLYTWLHALLGYYVNTMDLGELFGQRIAFRLADDYGPEPDIAFVKKSRTHLIERGYVNGPPDLAIEIVSPDSIDRDYKLKLNAYESFGVSEYWIVDEEQHRVVLLRRNKKGEFQEVSPRKGVLKSNVLGGFWFKPEWLWMNPLPRLRLVLNQILGPLM